jgi:hypothetical protein
MQSRIGTVLVLGLLLLAASAAAALPRGGFGGGMRFGGAGMHFGGVGHGFGASGLRPGARPLGNNPVGGLSHFAAHASLAPSVRHFAGGPRFFPQHSVFIDGFHHPVFVDSFRHHVFVNAFFFEPFFGSFSFAAPGVVVTASPFFFPPFGAFVTAPFFCFPCGLRFATEAAFLNHVHRLHHLRTQLARSFQGRSVVFVGT